MRPFLQPLAALAWLSLLASFAQADGKRLNGPEISQLLAGHRLISAPGADQAVQVFNPDGTAGYQSGDKLLQGRWKIVGDKYCSAWDEKAEPKCSDVFVDLPAVAFVGQDGEKHLWVLAKP